MSMQKGQSTCASTWPELTKMEWTLIPMPRHVAEGQADRQTENGQSWMALYADFN